MWWWERVPQTKHFLGSVPKCRHFCQSWLDIACERKIFLWSQKIFKFFAYYFSNMKFCPMLPGPCMNVLIDSSWAWLYLDYFANYGSRAFSVIGLKIYNSLPYYHHSSKKYQASQLLNRKWKHTNFRKVITNLIRYDPIKAFKLLTWKWIFYNLVV